MCRTDGELADLYSVYRPVARKEQRCGECRRTILIGEPYERHSMVYEGTASDHVICAHCAVLMVWIARECGGTLTGELIEDIEEHAKEYERGDLGNLAACARAHWMKGPSFRKPYPGIPVPKLPPPLSTAPTVPGDSRG